MAATHPFMGPAQMPFDMPNLPATEGYSNRLDSYDLFGSADKLTTIPYKAVKSDHSLLTTGYLDNIGRTSRLYSEQQENVNVFMSYASVAPAPGIVTYHIFSSGRIEKRVPARIQAGYENKYKYVYHDSSNTEHDICTAEWTKVKKKANGRQIPAPPEGNRVSDTNVVEGDTRRRIKYRNGDIAEYGRKSGANVWILYSALNESVEIVRMPDSLSYSNSGVNVQYTFSNTQRRYTGTGALAGFIGALAETGFTLVTTGSCFKEASAFPSLTHVNGESVDTVYFYASGGGLNYPKNQTFIDAMKKFHFQQILVGERYISRFRNCGNGRALHNSHLHSGRFNDASVVLIEQPSQPMTA